MMKTITLIYSLLGSLQKFKTFLVGIVCIFAAFSTSGFSAELSTLQVNGAELEYEVSGKGEPVLLIHGTGVAATFAPTLHEPALAGYQLIRFHRRGWAGSDRAPVPFSIADHAADAQAILNALNITKAHIVGHSYGGSVALQLALDAPDMVHSLVVMEPPIFDKNASPGAFDQLIARYESGDKVGAMETFSQMSFGPQWMQLARKVDPFGPEQVINDVDTVFQSEAQAMMQWGFGLEEASQIKLPIIYVTGGTAHGASLNLLQDWIEPVIDVTVVPGVGHAMLMQDPKGVAEAVAQFLARHPM